MKSTCALYGVCAANVAPTLYQALEEMCKWHLDVAAKALASNVELWIQELHGSDSVLTEALVLDSVQE